MAIDSGYSITGLTILAKGSGFAEDDEYDLIALDPGLGSGFTGQALTNGDGEVSSINLTAGGSNYSSGSWSIQPAGSAVSTCYNSGGSTIAYGATTFYTNTSVTTTNNKFGFYDGWGYFQVLTYTSQTGAGPSYFSGVTGWRTFPPQVSQSAQYGNAASSHPAVPHGNSLYNVKRSLTQNFGAFTSISIVNAPGSGSIIVPTIGFANDISISDMNTEIGYDSDEPNSDIHDLYQAFNVSTKANKKNFDWYANGPAVAGTLETHPIRFDEFFSSTYDAYAGSGCFSIDTPISMADGSLKNIEDVNISEKILSLTIPTMPLDFDDEDTWKDWETNTISGSEFTTSTVKEIYFDWYENYYILNDRIKVTFEHPFFVKHDSKYEFVKTEDLIIGDEILTDTSGSFTFESITSKELIEEELETVNLNVEPSDVYFAGGVLVHNVHDK